MCFGLLDSLPRVATTSFYKRSTPTKRRSCRKTEVLYKKLFKTDAILPDRVNSLLQSFLRDTSDVIILFLEKKWITIRCNNNSKPLAILSTMVYFLDSREYLCHGIWLHASLFNRGERCVYKYDNTTKSNERISQYHTCRHFRGNLIYFLKCIVCWMDDKPTHGTTRAPQVFRKTIHYSGAE